MYIQSMKPHFKPIPSESNLFKIELQENSKEFDYPWHYHPELEITYILSSHGVRYVGNSTENFYCDDLVLLGANLPHTWHISGDEDEPATAIVIYLKEGFLNETWMQSIEFKAIAGLLTEMNKGIVVDREKALQLKPKFLRLLNAPAFERMIILLEILQDLARNTQFRFLCSQEFTGALNRTDNARINAVYDYIQSHYLQQVSLSEISNRVNMSEKYFSRFFSKVMKKPFFEFLNEYRINRACKLLIETDMQISEVCYSSGFESVSFFYRQFRKFKGCQPKTYRRNYQRVAELRLLAS
ncbi:AraC family transcriptional regulator [Chitinophaga cymbidii]|uniref:AraC family transcriptional regulator n=2 Tax=Chitinophaga cymbidii TaxID=1096750 RepID=A0A512RPB9_9BACT|nr:AraC family transcriptional regulator [Chitinophaga cymbidii]